LRPLDAQDPLTAPRRSGPSGGPWTLRALWRPLDAQDPLADPGRSGSSGGPWTLRTLWRTLDAQDPLAAPGRSGPSGGPWTLRTLLRPLVAPGCPDRSRLSSRSDPSSGPGNSTIYGCSGHIGRPVYSRRPVHSSDLGSGRFILPGHSCRLGRYSRHRYIHCYLCQVDKSSNGPLNTVKSAIPLIRKIKKSSRSLLYDCLSICYACIYLCAVLKAAPARCLIIGKIFALFLARRLTISRVFYPPWRILFIMMPC
jgi:hypothetical protein